MDFSDRSIIITGAGGGVGKRTAIEMASRGALLTLCDIDKAKVDAVVDEITTAGGKAQSVLCDVTDYDQAKATVEKALSSYGKVDVLINNAGTGTINAFVGTTPEDWRRDVDLCLYGVMNFTHAVLPSMIERGSGKVLSVCSDAGRVGEPNLAAYSAAKAGVVGFTKAVAKEVGRYNVLVNCVCFSTVRTEVFEMLFSINPEMEQKMIKRYPMKRVATMDEAANTLMLMSSDYVTFITGQTLSMNGGYAMVS